MDEYRGVRWFEKDVEIYPPDVNPEVLRAAANMKTSVAYAYVAGHLTADIMLDLQRRDLSPVNGELRAPAAYIELCSRSEFGLWIAFLVKTLRAHRSFKKERYFISTYRMYPFWSYQEFINERINSRKDEASK